MQERHTNREKYFAEQAYTVSTHVIPMLEQVMTIDENTSVLEIGCGEGGNLKPFADRGCKRVVGIDLASNKIENAARFYADHPNRNKLTFIHDDIYQTDDLGTFDLILTRDVLEHIHDQERFLHYVKRFMKADTRFFLGFPPWYNPYGGHQQVCENRLLSKLPWFHLLPVPLYRMILKLGGEPAARIEGLLEVKETGISIERFERLLKKTGYRKEKRIFYLVNPNYEVKFGLKPRVQSKLISSVPFLRDFLITTNYYIVSSK